MSLTKQSPYPIATGESDYKRLAILNRLYNPTTQAFIKEAGLRSGMHVLEIGCGYGQMACWLAKEVGPNGKVIAIDSSAEQLKIARTESTKLGLSNIEFMELDLRQLNELSQQFDIIFGRWVIEFLVDHDLVLQMIYNLLQSTGVFIYETYNVIDNGHFTFPTHPAVEEWFTMWRKNFGAMNLDLNFGFHLFDLLNHAGFKNIKIATNQAVLQTPEEISILRLGSLNTYQSIINNKAMTQSEFDDFIKKLIELENKDIRVGFLRTILYRATK